MIPDGSVNEATLRELLSEQAEAHNLEFKQLRDLDDSRDVVKFALDVAAMQSIGGYIIIGVDDHGTPTGTLNERHLQLFDEAVVRDKLKKYIPEPFDLRIGVHELAGCRIALVYVPRRPSGLTVLRAIGEYEASGQKQREFVAGDIFVRRGTKRERATQADVDSALSAAATSPERTPALSGGGQQLPRMFHPPLGASDRGLVARAALSVPTNGVEPLIDSGTRKELADYLVGAPIELHIATLLPPEADWWTGMWDEEGFNTASVVTLARRSPIMDRLWASTVVANPQFPTAAGRVTLVVDAVFEPKARIRRVEGTSRFGGFEQRLELRQIYELIHALVATAAKLLHWSRLNDWAQQPFTSKGPDLFLDAGENRLGELIDFGKWRRLDRSWAPPWTWQDPPPSFQIEDLDARDRLIKDWLKKTMLNAGFRDFEYQLDSLVAHRWES